MVVYLGRLFHFEVYRDEKGEWRWRLVASNGRIIADSSEGYKRKFNCLRIIENIKSKVPQAKVTVKS